MFWVEASNTSKRCGGSSWLLGNPSTQHCALAVPWGTLQIRIQFVRQRGRLRCPFLPLKQTNKQTNKQSNCVFLVKVYVATSQPSRSRRLLEFLLKNVSFYRKRDVKVGISTWSQRSTKHAHSRLPNKCNS